MKIAIGKIGKAISFNPKRWVVTNGDDVPLMLYDFLCKSYPQHEFYMIGGSDLTKCVEKGIYVKPDNMFDLYDLAKKALKADPERHPKEYPGSKMQCHYLVDILDEKDIHFDFGLFIQGPDTSPCIPGMGIYTKDGTHHVKPFTMAQNYVAPIFISMNREKVPYVIINEDVRYIPCVSRDIIEGHDEICYLSQINCDKKYNRIKGYGEDSKIVRPVIQKFRYAAVETFPLLKEKKYDFTNPDHIDIDGTIYKKDLGFIMAQSGGGDRLALIEKWILAGNPKQIIYGLWDEEAQAKHPGTFVNKMSSEMEDVFWRSKYSFILPFRKNVPNFVTRKPWTLMRFGIIPFMDKNGYDTDHLIDFPDICRVSSPEEMWERIALLEKDKELYKKTLKQIYDLLKDKYFNGQHILNLVGGLLDKYGKK